MLTEKELEIRKIIWTELSDFYLDTDLSDEDLIRKGLVFRDSGLTTEEIKEINYYEVGPQLIDNLKSIAGVWDGFNQEGLHKVLEILTRTERKRPKNIFQKLDDYIDRKSLDFYTKRYFDKIEYLMSTTKD
jgi:hypothetical protein